jgi:threonine dehydrogenase-like Zn-dependent dehydrogenase
VRALWLEDRRLIFREDAPEPAAGGEAMVRVSCAGICNTDLELLRGYYPFTGVPGHEFVGVVEASPEATWLGRRVVGEINAVCGACAACGAGRRNHCERRSVLGIRARDGAFGERLRLPAANLHLVPDELADEAAIFVEPLAAALEIQEQVAFSPGQRVVVVGDGKLGQLVARTLALTGVDLVAVGRHRAKLERLEAAGIATAPAACVPERRADVVVECTGNSEGLAFALKTVRPAGTVVLKSTYRGEATLNVSALVVDEVRLVGSRCGPFAPALALLAQRRIDVGPLVEARYPLSEGLDAFDHAARSGVLKVLLTP